MDKTISRRSAIKRMGAAVAGMTAVSAIPSLAASFPNASPAPKNPAEADTSGESTLNMPDYPLVFENNDVVFHRIDEHTWVGNGHLVYNESVYIVEGRDKALLIDTGTKIDHLDSIVASITKKPVTLVLTHNHADHSGSIKWFNELWVADAPGAQPIRGFNGKINHIANHQIFDLGGRKIEAVWAPGHTADSTIFIDRERHYGFSGDAFGSTNLLMTLDVSTFVKTAEETLRLMVDQEIFYMFPGHYEGTNAETTKRVYDLLVIARDVLEGRREGGKADGGMGLDRILTWQGVRFNYNSKRVM